MLRKREAPDEQGGFEHGFVRQKKKLRTYTASDAELAKHYEELASEVGETRIKAATELIKNVEGRIAEQGELEGAVSPLQSQRKIYVRLIRGLCSSRKAARMGFSIALTELWRLALQADVDERISDAIGLVKEYTEAEGGASSQERRDYALGRLSAYSAVLRCGALHHSSTLTAVRCVLDELFAVYTQVPWLREECGVVLCETVEQADSAHSDFVRAIIDAMVTAGIARSPEGIVVWLRAMQYQPQVKLPKDVWYHRNPLHRKDMASVFKIIRQNTTDGTVNDTQTTSSYTGARRQTPHFAWAAVLQYIVTVDGDATLFERYWQETFDDYFFAKSASPEKKALGFQNFARAIAWAPSSKFEIMFSQNFMTVLINQSAQSQRYLHAAARSTLSAFVARARTETDPKTVCDLLRSLLAGHGTLTFDRATSTKTVHDLLSMVDAGILLLIVNEVFFPLLIVKPLEDLKNATIQRQTVLDLLLSTVRSRDLAEESPAFDEPHWLLSILKHLAAQSFDAGPLPETVRSVFSAKLFSILSHVLSSGAEDALEYPAWVVQFTTSDEIQLQIIDDSDDAVKASLEQAQITFEKLIAIPSLETSDEDSPERRILRLLFSMTMLQAYSAETDAIELLGDLQQCYVDVLGRGSAKARGIEAIMDIILDFASRQSALHRKLAEEVFAAFAPNLTSDSLNTMLEVLEQKETVAGQQALFERGGDDDEGDNEDEGDATSETGSSLEQDDESNDNGSDVEIIEADSDVEEVNGDGSAGESASPSSEEDNGESDNDDDDDDDDDELARFDAMLASTLGTNAADEAASDSDADMDDEQMMALEPHLAAIFRERATAAAKDNKPSQKKADHRSAKETITAFKNRVLDLLLIYVRNCADRGLALDIVLPLLALIRTTGSKQLADKAHSLLRQYFDLAKKKGWGVATTAEPDSPNMNLELRLADIHAEALLFASKAHAAACSSASLFMARGFVRIGPEDASDLDDPKAIRDAAMDHLIDLYAQTHKQRQQLGVKSGLPASFWEDWVRWSLQVAN